MYTDTYDKIESTIKKSDYYVQMCLCVEIFYSIIMIGSVATLLLYWLDNVIGWIVFGCALAISLLSLYCLYFKTIYNVSNSADFLVAKSADDLSSCKPLKRYEIYRLDKMCRLSKILKHTKPSVIHIIKSCKITTKDGLKEAIEHFRFKSQTTRQPQIDTIAVLALAVGVIGYLLNAESLPSGISVPIFSAALAIVFMICLLVMYFGRRFFAPYRKKAFYERVENALSEICALNMLTARGRKRISDK